MNRNAALVGLVTALALSITVAPALAQSANTTVFTSVSNTATDIFTNTRNILMVVGAIGVLALATMAFFGKFKWHWAVSLLGGLTLIAFVSQVISYFGLNGPPT
jgi:type IV secretory pathway VirB2 component (pilin)